MKIKKEGKLCLNMKKVKKYIMIVGQELFFITYFYFIRIYR